MVTTTYGKVEDGKIVKYPVIEEEVDACLDPEALFYPCHSDEEPSLSLNEKIVEKPKLIGNAIFVDQTIVKKTIDEMFQYLGKVALSIGAGGSPVFDVNLISAELFDAFEEIVKNTIQDDLDAFAQTRNYDGIASLCSYNNSTNEDFKKESTRGNVLRDDTWKIITKYFKDVKSGEVKVPLSWAEIKAILPTLSWE